MDAKGRNYLIAGVELNWARLAEPVSPFGTAQYELQIATTDAAKAEELKANHLTVKEKDGKFTVSLKRKATKADGSPMGAPRVVDAAKAAMSVEAIKTIGNESMGNVIVRQYPYDTAGRKGIATMLEAVQVTDLKEFVATGGVDFDVVAEAPAAEGSADLF